MNNVIWENQNWFGIVTTFMPSGMIKEDMSNPLCSLHCMHDVIFINVLIRVSASSEINFSDLLKLRWCIFVSKNVDWSFSLAFSVAAETLSAIH